MTARETELWPKVPESHGDVLTSRGNLRTAAMGAIGSMQAAEGFLWDRDDLSREYIAEVIRSAWRKLRAVAEGTPTIYGPGGRPSSTDDPTGDEG